jgi:BioD-like phosphotransacetylase family protein
MSLLFIGSTGNHAGKSLLTWAIAQRLAEKGLNVGFMKPFGTLPVRIDGVWTDPDALLLKEALNLREPFERICPYLVSEDGWREKDKGVIIEELKVLVQELSSEKDILLIMGTQNIFFDESLFPVPDTTLINTLPSDAILVDRYQQPSTSLYSILSISSLLKERLKGVLLNRVPPEMLKSITDQTMPSLSQKGIPVMAAVPEDPGLSFQTLGDIMATLNGKILCEEESLGNPIGGMTVSSADLEGELRIFRRVYNKIVLLEPSLPDVNTGGASRTVAGILLTGGRTPPPQVVKACEEARVPLILVEEDTFSAQEHLEQHPPRLSPRDKNKMRYFTELLDRNGALDTLLQSLGLLS